MADSKGNIKRPDPDEHGTAVTSVTTNDSHPADADSSPGPYNDLPINRPGVSTNRPDMPIAQSLVTGAGAPSPSEDAPEDVPANVKVSKSDTVEKVEG